MIKSFCLQKQLQAAQAVCDRSPTSPPISTAVAPYHQPSHDTRLDLRPDGNLPKRHYPCATVVRRYGAGESAAAATHPFPADRQPQRSTARELGCVLACCDF